MIICPVCNNICHFNLLIFAKGDFFFYACKQKGEKGDQGQVGIAGMPGLPGTPVSFTPAKPLSSIFYTLLMVTVFSHSRQYNKIYSCVRCVISGSHMFIHDNDQSPFSFPLLYRGDLALMGRGACQEKM